MVLRYNKYFIISILSILFIPAISLAAPQTFRLKVGEMQGIDVNGDGQADVQLDLRGLSALGQSSVMGIKKMEAPVTPPVAPSVEEPTVVLPAPVNNVLETVSPVSEAIEQAARNFVVKPIVETTKAVVGTTSKVITETRANPQVQKAVRRQVVPVTTVAAAAPLISVLAISNLTLLELPILLFFFILRLLERVGLRRRRLKVGVTYDGATKQVLPLTLVRLYSQKQKKYLCSGYADLRGVYGLPEITSGKDEFYIQAVKMGYVFPSQLVTTPVDPPYDQVYHGESIIWSGSGVKNVPAHDIPLDPVSTSASWKYQIRKIWQGVAQAAHYIHWPLLVLGLIASAFAWLMNSTPGYTLLFFFYLVLFLMTLVTTKLTPRAVK